MDEEKVRVLRTFGSVVLEGIGMWLMVFTWFFAQGGPRFLTLEMAGAAVGAVGWLLFRGGWALR